MLVHSGSTLCILVHVSGSRDGVCSCLVLLLFVWLCQAWLEFFSCRGINKSINQLKSLSESVCSLSSRPSSFFSTCVYCVVCIVLGLLCCIPEILTPPLEIGLTACPLASQAMLAGGQEQTHPRPHSVMGHPLNGGFPPERKRHRPPSQRWLCMVYYLNPVKAQFSSRIVPAATKNVFVIKLFTK